MKIFLKGAFDRLAAGRGRTKPLCLLGEIDFAPPTRMGDAPNRPLDRRLTDLQSDAKLWYHSLDFGEGVAFGLA